MTNLLKQLVKSSEWMDGYRAGKEYGILKEREHPQVLRFGVEVKLNKNRKVLIKGKKFKTFQKALDWADWNFKLRRDYFTIVDLEENY